MTHAPLRLAVGFAIALLAAPAAAADLSPVGQWEAEGGASRFRVSYCGNGTQLCAKLVWLHQDARTPGNLALLNSYVVSGALPADENEWAGTVQFEGNSYAGTVTQVSRNAMRLNCCSGIFCRSFVLSRI